LLYSPIKMKKYFFTFFYLPPFYFFPSQFLSLHA